MKPVKQPLPEDRPGHLDVPLVPPLGPADPCVPTPLGILSLAVVAVALAPLMSPWDFVIVALQCAVLVTAWWCGGRQPDVPLALPAQHRADTLPAALAFAHAAGASSTPASVGTPDASLIVESAEYPVKDLALIGRSEDCHIPLDDPSLALYQAVIVPSGGKLSILNLQSADMSINGRRLAEATIEPGDVIRLGRTMLVYYRDEAVIGAPPPVRDAGSPVARLGPLALSRSSHYWIGRGAGCDLVVADASAADRHALLCVGVSGTVTLVDFTSPLGTRINQRRSHFRTLADGDVLTIGQTRLTFSERVG